MVINRTEGSSIRSVFIRVINKIGRPRGGSPICVITSMITDRIRRHEVLLPINKYRYNFRGNKCILFGERTFEYQMSKIRGKITGRDTV